MTSFRDPQVLRLFFKSGGRSVFRYPLIRDPALWVPYVGRLASETLPQLDRSNFAPVLRKGAGLHVSVV